MNPNIKRDEVNPAQAGDFLACPDFNREGHESFEVSGLSKVFQHRASGG